MFREAQDFVTNYNEMGSLFTALLQAINDHGGDARHLNKLLENAKGDRTMINKIARMAIGRIWELVETPVDMDRMLDDVSFSCRPEQFLKSYMGLKIHPGMDLACGGYSETKPRGPCLYRLGHFGKQVLFDEVLNAFPIGGREEHAGWRELLAFVNYWSPDDFSGYRIQAAGSRNLICRYGRSPEVSHGTIFPVADGSVNGTEISWCGVKRRLEDKFALNHFWLVRVYS